MEMQQQSYTANQYYPRSRNGASGFRSKDVIFTQGELFEKHSGNLRFGTIVHSFVDEYKSTQRRSEKIRITHEIVATVKRYGGRFVTFDPILGKWEELPKSLARKKVSHALREVFPRGDVEHEAKRVN